MLHRLANAPILHLHRIYISVGYPWALNIITRWGCFVRRLFSTLVDNMRWFENGAEFQHVGWKCVLTQFLCEKIAFCFVVHILHNLH